MYGIILFADGEEGGRLDLRLNNGQIKHFQVDKIFIIYKKKRKKIIFQRVYLI